MDKILYWAQRGPFGLYMVAPSSGKTPEPACAGGEENGLERRKIGREKGQAQYLRCAEAII